MATHETGTVLDRYFDFYKSMRAGSDNAISAHPFKAERKAHFHAWAKRNLALLSRILPGSLLIRILERTLDVRSSEQIATRVEQFLFGSFSIGDRTFYDLLTKDRPGLRRGVWALTESYMKGKVGAAKRLVDSGMTILLVRPEILYLADLIREFLALNGYDEVWAETIALSPEQYFSIYNHVFDDPVKESHVRRRAFGYIRQECRVMLVRKRSIGRDGLRSTIELSEQLKGTVRVEDFRTLRGGIGFSEAWINCSDTDPRVRQALDPYESYTLLDRTTLGLSETERFISNLHSVHVPNEHEVLKDMCILCDIETLRSV